MSLCGYKIEGAILSWIHYETRWLDQFYSTMCELCFCAVYIQSITKCISPLEPFHIWPPFAAITSASLLECVSIGFAHRETINSSSSGRVDGERL